ncbi:hypothetical protein B0E49_16345 [Polaromonas sp. C04]|nr:hypothetical protein B0E49_16345 [Polaromonas sp. C04]
MLVERQNATLLFTINRAEKRNALSGDVADALLEAIQEAGLDPSVRSVVVRGAGSAAFSSGADLKERAAADANQKWQLSRKLFNINQAILASSKIFYASINGWCLGGGLELALACDFRIADPTSIFGWPETRLGAYPGAGAAVILPRLIGFQKAKAFLLNTENIDAQHALAIGLIDAQSEEGCASTMCVERAKGLALIAPLAQAAIKASIRSTAGLSLDEAFRVDGEFRKPLEATLDYQEGIKAFFEKRQPNFVGG